MYIIFNHLNAFDTQSVQESLSEEFLRFLSFFLLFCFSFLGGGDGDLSESELFEDDDELELLEELEDELESLSDEDSLSLKNPKKKIN